MKGSDKANRRRKKAKAQRAALAAAYPSPRSYAAREGTVRGVVVGPTRVVSESGDKRMFTLDLVDLDREGPTERIELGFFAHGFTFEPQTPERAALFEKRGRGAAHVDLCAREVLQVIEPMAGHHFYGHGTYARTGDVLFAVESHLTEGRGAISVRDPKTFAVLDTFPTYGARPHDCVLIDQGSTLAITNGGGVVGGTETPCVTFVHIASRKLLEKHEVTSPRINTGHIAVGQGHDFAVVSAPREGLPEATSLGGVSLRTNRKKLCHITAPREVAGQLFGETLSVALFEGTVAATTPQAGMLTFWDLATQRLKKALQLPNVRGLTVTLDGKQLVASYGPEATYALFDTSTLERSSADGGRARFSGSHLFTWAFPAA